MAKCSSDKCTNNVKKEGEKCEECQAKEKAEIARKMAQFRQTANSQLPVPSPNDKNKDKDEGFGK